MSAQAASPAAARQRLSAVIMTAGTAPWAGSVIPFPSVSLAERVFILAERRAGGRMRPVARRQAGGTRRCAPSAAGVTPGMAVSGPHGALALPNAVAGA